MSDHTWVIIPLTILGTTLFLGFKVITQRAIQRMVIEFRQKFPGKCMICANHRYGFRHGFTSEPEPKHHDCIEKNPRPTPNDLLLGACEPETENPPAGGAGES